MDLGGDRECRGCALPPPPQDKAFFVFAFNIVYVSSLLCHSLVAHPLLRKIQHPPLMLIQKLPGDLWHHCRGLEKEILMLHPINQRAHQFNLFLNHVIAAMYKLPSDKSSYLLMAKLFNYIELASRRPGTMILKQIALVRALAYGMQH